MKTYVLLVSRTFPKGHKREGEQTFFVEKIRRNIDCKECPHELCDNCGLGDVWNKLHTCRKNYELWAKRIKEVQEGKAVLSLRYWSGKPYRSKQVEFAVLDKDSGMGVQKLLFGINDLLYPIAGEGIWNRLLNLENLAKNDGLSIDDFKDWFKNYDLSKPMAIIQFTEFRY